MTVTKEEVAERLVSAAACMSARSHFKSPGAGGQCVWTAIVESRSDGESFDRRIEVGDAAVDAIKAALGVGLNTGIFNWNDRPERTKDECMELLVTTADKVRNGDLVLEGVS